MTDMSDRIDESMSVSPGEESQGATQAKDAGHDESIAQRLEKNPESKEARLDRALDESMDASDPPASTQPVHNHQPPASSGYDEEAERKLKAEG